MLRLLVLMLVMVWVLGMMLGLWVCMILVWVSASGTHIIPLVCEAVHADPCVRVCRYNPSPSLVNTDF
jgi:hypothetical protein